MNYLPQHNLLTIGKSLKSIRLIFGKTAPRSITRSETCTLQAADNSNEQLVQVNVPSNWAVYVQKSVTLVVSHPHCKSSELFTPLHIKDIALRHYALSRTLEGEGFLVTVSVAFKIQDKHISEQSDVLLRAFFGNKLVLPNENVQAEVGNAILFTVYLYGPIASALLLRVEDNEDIASSTPHRYKRIIIDVTDLTDGANKYLHVIEQAVTRILKRACEDCPVFWPHVNRYVPTDSV